MHSTTISSRILLMMTFVMQLSFLWDRGGGIFYVEPSGGIDINRAGIALESSGDPCNDANSLDNEPTRFQATVAVCVNVTFLRESGGSLGSWDSSVGRVLDIDWRVAGSAPGSIGGMFVFFRVNLPC